MQRIRNRSSLGALWLFMLTGLIACAGPRPVTPREYLDEQTSATIRVVADPLIFVRERSETRPDQRDFLNLYAIDVNRMGDHRQYLAVLQWAPPLELSGAPTLELRTGEHTLALQPSREEPKQLGIARPLAESYAQSKWWYFPVDKEALAAIARSEELRAALVVGDARIPYAIWRDGRAELAELTSALP